jgi:hypothetical protein
MNSFLRTCTDTKSMKNKILFLASGLLIFFIVAIGTWVYIHKEKYFYFWDIAVYQNITLNLVGVLRNDLLKTIDVIKQSMGEDYSFLFSIPLFPLLKLFSFIGFQDFHIKSLNYDTRISFILSLNFAYLFPYILSFGLIATSVKSNLSKWMRWIIGLCAALIVPAVWLPTLRGFPDTGAAFLVVLAVVFYLVDMKLRRIWQIPLISIFLGLALLFRRHFMYEIIAYFLALGSLWLINLIICARNKSISWKQTFIEGLRIIITGISMVAFLALVSPSFLSHIISQNSFALYLSYDVDPIPLITYFSNFYGWGLLLLSFAGYGLFVFSISIDRLKWISLFLFGFYCILLWTFVAKFVNPHYTLHYTFFIVVGLICLFMYIAQAKKVVKITFISAFIVYTIINMLIWFGEPVPAFVSSFRNIFTDSTQPNKRNDYSEIIRLAEFLQGNVSNNAPIYVVDSSGVMNEDLLRNADKVASPNSSRLNIMNVPAVDSRDYYPLEGLLHAQYVVVSTPYQRHLQINESGVSYAPFLAFDTKWELSKDFELMPFEANLYPDIKTHVYHRTRPTSAETAIRTLTQIENVVGQRPGNQIDWIALASTNESIVYWDVPGKGFLNSTISYPDQSEFLWIGQPRTGLEFQATTSIADQNCASYLTLQIFSANENGETTAVSPKVPIKNDNSDTLTIPLDNQSVQGRYLLLALSASTDQPLVCKNVGLNLMQPRMNTK